MKTGYEIYEELLEVLGAEVLLEELVQALTGDDLMDNMEYIATNDGVEVGE